MPENRMNQSYCLADQRDSFRKWFCRALLAIAQDGVPQVAQLRADLVFASRQQLDRQLGRSSRDGPWPASCFARVFQNPRI